MSFQSRRELLAKVAPRYREANRKQKTIILNEFVESSDYKRKHAIRLLSLPEIPLAKQIKRPRSRYYGEAVQEALLVAWSATNYIASKRLAPFLEELVPALERHGHLKLTEEVRTQLISISPATIDRILRPLRSGDQLRGKSTTKSGSLLKRQIPVRTFSDWEETTPGFFEVDLVAHCGWSTEGSFLYTIVLTDIAIGWVECLPLLHRSKHAVINALEHARQLIPFPILGLDTDNGSEFINPELIAYCERESVTFTRGRAYKKNDQCYVEQKNGAIVRQFVGYDRFEGQRAYKQLTELYRALRLYINFFQPSMKLRKKERENSKVHRKYDTVRTPYQRLCSSGTGDAKMIERLNSIYHALDPVRLLKQIQALQDALWQHAVLIMQLHPSGNTDSKDKHELRFRASMCGLSDEPGKDGMNDDLVIKAGERNKRKYRRTKKTKIPRWWRTRKDPFEGVGDEICQWLENNPERTAKSLLVALQERYPGQYHDNQLRTLQRRVQNWRAKVIITFDDEWLHEEVMSDNVLLPQLGAIMMETNPSEEIDSNVTNEGLSSEQM